MNQISKINILVLGESLFDCFPTAKKIGGAPLNFAIHGARLGVNTTLVSRIGDDELGTKIKQTLLEENVKIDYLQIDNKSRQTGQVIVNLTEKGEPEYKIIENVAWDYLSFSSQLAENLSNYHCLYFGTLAQRNTKTRETINQYLKLFEGFKFLDLNLRQSYYSQELIYDSIMLADGLKLNLEEAQHLQKNYNFDSNLQNWLEKYKLQWIVLTQGAKGTKWIDKNGIIESNPVPNNPTENADNVGAGDAVAAVSIIGYLQGLSPIKIIEKANKIGAYVASFSGAIPPYNSEKINMIID